MTSPVRVTSLVFNGGSVVDTSAADVVVLVGPNNCGKSRTLQEMQTRLNWHPSHGSIDAHCFVLDRIEIQKEIEPNDIGSWLRANRFTWIPQGDLRERVRTLGAGELFLEDAPSHWGIADTLAQLGPHMMRALFAAERLVYLGAPERRDVGAPPEHPLQVLSGNPQLRDALAKIFKQAFRLNLMLDAWGANIKLRVSRNQQQRDFEYASLDGFPSAELAAKLGALPAIETQSDGVRSFAGILLTLMAGNYPLVFLDEPEAFLHPPQARLLGRELAEQHYKAQLFVATHSLDILLGLLESSADKMLIVRLSRESDRTSAQMLTSDMVANLWDDPLLRFSRTLDGLFHEGVIVGEGDTDTGFYSAVATGGDAPLTQGRHLMFTYAGSKHRIPLVTSALRAVGVPVRAIVDFDALNNAGTLRALLEGVGGTWTDDIGRLLGIVDAHLRGSEAKTTVGKAKSAIEEALDSDDSTEITRTMVEKINQALAPETGWRAAKRSGEAAVPGGDATVALNELLSLLQEAGLFVVRSGAVESFVKEVGGKGPRWLVEVVAGGHVPRATEAHAFVQEVVGSIGT